MWFKNLLVYRLTQTIDLTPDTLEAALQAKPARPCASQELSTYGFVPVHKGGEMLAHHAHGYTLIAARKEERILPSSVVKEAVQEKVDEIETLQMRKVYKKEKEQIKDEVIQAFLPRAFIKRRTTFAAILPESGLILVDASSPKVAEDLLSTLRDTLGSLPVRPLGVKQAPTATMTDWVRSGDATHGLFILDQASLVDAGEEGGKVVATGQDLTSDEIQNHLGAGKLVSKLALAWSDKLSFVLNDKAQVTRLRFEDLLQDQAEADGGDDAAAQFDASFVLMCLTLEEFLPQLVEALGGEEIPQGLGGEPDMVPLTTKAPRAPVREEQLDVFTSSQQAEDDSEAGSGFGDASDPMYAEAVAFVRETKRPSISAVQRRLKIGYNRAARMIEQMELDGVISPMDSHGHREVIGQEAVAL
ncbi:recombination-associated protein RdgC (plasmid) [Pseudomonas oryzihabitans]|nr:recombination-associated protein RdgC [Pseudomonas psychrotolerans]